MVDKKEEMSFILPFVDPFGDLQGKEYWSFATGNSTTHAVRDCCYVMIDREKSGGKSDERNGKDYTKCLPYIN